MSESTRRSVLAGMATVPLLTVPALASDDAAFLALYDKYLAAKAAAKVACDAHEAEATVMALWKREWDLLDEVAAHPVTTLEGVRIKLMLIQDELRIFLDDSKNEHIILADTALAGVERLIAGSVS